MILNLILFFILHSFGYSDSEQPKFKGGTKNLNAFISNYLIYPDFSKENCLQGTVQVGFKLNRQGRVYDSEVQKGYGTDLDLEALRVVRLSSGRWIIPPGYDTSLVVILPVNFTLQGYKCNERSKDEINEAINAYHARQDLSKVIFNFYDKKSSGEYDPADEMRILTMKAQLGYTTKYIDRLLKQAQRKLKQGDRESACDDFQTIRRLGSDKSAAYIEHNCK